MNQIVGSEEEKLAAIVKLLESLKPETATVFALGVMRGMGDGLDKFMKSQAEKTP